MPPKRTKAKASKEAGDATSPPKKQKTAAKMSEPEKAVVDESEDTDEEPVAPVKAARGRKAAVKNDADTVNGKAEPKKKAAAPRAAPKGRAKKAKEEEEAPAKEAAPAKRGRGKKAVAEEKPADVPEEEPEEDAGPAPAKKGRGGRKAKAAAVAEEETGAEETEQTVAASVTVRGGRNAKKAEESSPPKKAGRKAKNAPPVTSEADEDEVVTSSSNGKQEANGVEVAETKVPKKKAGKAAKDEPKEKKAKATTGRKRANSVDKSAAPAKIALNSTATKWQELTFACSTPNKEGHTYNVHVTSWNVGGIRSWLKKGALQLLDFDKPDVLCVQETKCNVDQLPEELQNVQGYKAYWCASEKDGYAGVAIFTKTEPIQVTNGIGDAEQDAQGRCITAEFERFFLVNVYVPNAGRGLVTLPHRLKWNALFKEYIKGLDARKPVIVCGDMNVAHEEIDLANPKSNQKNAGFTPEERAGMTEFLAEGYVDTFRALYPERKDAYTFWTYMGGARARNVGWRLDYFIVSDRIKDKICDQIIQSNVLGSDHCPLTLYFNL